MTGLDTRPVSAARLGFGTSHPGLHALGSASSSCLMFFVFKSESLPSSLCEPRLTFMLNIRALSVTVYSRTVIAKHLCEEQKRPSYTDECSLVSEHVSAVRTVSC